MNPIFVSCATAVNALGAGCRTVLDALLNDRSGLQRNDFEPGLDTWIGRVPELENRPVTGDLAAFDCRNNRLAQWALQQDGFAAAVGQARQRYGAERIGVFLGTSTSGILETELGFRQQIDGTLPAHLNYPGSHNLHSVTEFTRRYLQLCGPAHTISTACSSSAKVFAAAWRHIEAGLCDAAVVGGVDTLCLTTLYGFHSLELLSESPCRPLDVARNGISIGEAAGFMLLERAATGDVWLAGFGESSDAYHMSTPDPDGAGAQLAMRQALARAGLQPAEIDYINLHGTGTQANDRAESAAICAVFGMATPCSSTKGWTGHTLGGAGISEAVIALLCLRHGFLPHTLNRETPDPALACRLVQRTERRPVRHVLSNSFGFGGSNCSLVFSRGA